MKLTLALLTMLLTVSLNAQIPGPDVPAGQGVNIHFTDPRPGEIQMLAAGGFGIVRMDFAWGSTERTRGVYDFAAYDRLMGHLDKQGIHALFILDYANPLYDGDLAPHTLEGRAAFARWASAAAKHFAGRGILWEMWNEPNLAQFWKPQPNPDDYALLAIEVGKAIRAAAPDEIFIGPASSNIDMPFLETCFKAGVLNYFSAVTVHPYRQNAPETVAEEYRKLRILIDQYAPAGRHIPILSGEWGYADIWDIAKSASQGKLLARQWLVNLSCDVPLSIWYDWHDDGTNPTDPEAHFGTVTYAYHEGRSPVYDPKPAYQAAQAFTANLKGYRFNKRLALASPDQWLLLFTKGTDIKLVAWTTSSAPQQATLPVSPGRFSATSCTGEPLPAISADAKGLTLQLTDSPVYLTPETPNEYLTLLANWTRLQTDQLIAAPATLTPDLQIRNTTTHPLRLFTSDQNSVEVAPGAAHATGSSYNLLRSGYPIRMRQQLHIEGFPPAFQESTLAVSNPILVTPMPAVGNQLALRIETPTGEPVAGRLQVLSPVKHSVDIATQRGERQTIVSIPFEQPLTRYTLSLQLTDSAGQPLTQIPSRGYRLLPLDLKDYTLLPDGDPKIASEQSAKLVPAPEGLPVSGVQSLQITYHFSPGWKFIRLAVTSPSVQPIEGKPQALGMWIHGDSSGNSPRLRFLDSTGQCFQPAVLDISYKGWQYVQIPLDSGQVGHWGGAADGIIHYPIRLDTLFLLDSPTQKGTTGAVHIAAPTLIYPAD
jgi:polysaccharide biosynthesis protein PslG